VTVVLTDAQLTAFDEEGFFVIDDFCSVNDARAARSAAQRMVDAQRLTAAGVSRAGSLQPRIRGDLTAFLDENELDAGFVGLVAALTDFQAALREQAWLTLPRRELQLGCYPGDGTGYARHVDAFRGASLTGHRRVTVVVWLNDGWHPEHGGCLQVATNADVVDVEPVLGRAIVFWSERVPHEVLPCFAPRFALTMWLSPST
jgi:Rps23 Pro-64 3,4-dihydroxylase Tpa1-like proline 4-hydroxylase